MVCSSSKHFHIIHCCVVVLPFLGLRMKLPNSSKAVFFIRKTPQNGDVLIVDSLKAVWDSDPLHMAHKLHHLLSKFNKIMSDDDQEDGMHTSFTQ